MNWYRRLVRRWCVLFCKEQMEGEMTEELQFHLETEIEANLRTGMSPEGARRAALVAFGGVERFKEQMRDARGGRQLDDLVRDIRFAHRQHHFRILVKMTVLTLQTRHVIDNHARCITHDDGLLQRIVGFNIPAMQGLAVVLAVGINRGETGILLQQGEALKVGKGGQLI